MAPAPLPVGTFVIVANAKSGHASLERLQSVLEDVLGQAGQPYHLILIQDPQTLPARLRQAAQAAQDCRGSLVVAGGDGSVRTAANLLRDHPCPLGILPLGTFNYFAREHGIPTGLEAAVQTLLQARAQPVTLGMVNQQLFLVNASLGLYPQLLEEREAFKQKLGRWRVVALIAALSTFLHQHRPQRLALTCDSQTMRLRLLTLFVTNSRLQAERLGLALPDPQQAPRLTLLLVRPGGLWARLGLLWRSALRRLDTAEQVRSFRFDQLQVQSAGLRPARRLKVAMDGEVVWLTPPLDFRLAPHSLQLLKPNAAPAETP